MALNCFRGGGSPEFLRSGPAILWCGAHEEFSSCPQLVVCCNNPAGNKLRFLGEGKPEKRKKREKKKEKNQIVKAAEITLSET